MKLTKKEQKLLWLDRYNRKHCSCSLTVGDYCRILHTTVFTLLSKTQPTLECKIKSRIKKVLQDV
ncbi:hypothetical protein KM792_13005 [Clostridium tyrobutyricum]|uniref:hypothetical protein n=1 Tax=Clostridium tyrobutyricum TaxID=1519 RepID=UPI0010AB0FB0|nr:hypothetical protein [Clostridium tyrobutyricum]MBV4450563.1 hypothetical protein [Clostridium tyrobutyricum]QCH27351.1 hypothetical protein EZN00_00946 [Clostridium tyrobutyricum]